jgi:hypothetical protein
MKRFFSPPYIVGYVLAILCVAVFIIANNGYGNYSINHKPRLLSPKCSVHRHLR